MWKACESAVCDRTLFFISVFSLTTSFSLLYILDFVFVLIFDLKVLPMILTGKMKRSEVFNKMQGIS